MKKAFTLIELLVVMAIIGILAAITIPALTGVKKAANNAKCSSNMKQVAMAALNYSLEKNKPTPTATYKLTDLIPAQATFWSSIGPYMSIKSADLTSEAAAITAIGDKRSALCPQTAKNDGVKKGISFGRNTTVAPGDGTVYYSNQSESPSKTCLIGNAGFGNTGYVEAITDQFVHPASSTNVGFLDGHVEAIPQTQFPAASTGTTPTGTGNLVGQTFWLGTLPP